MTRLGSSIQVAREALVTHAFNVFEQVREIPDLFEQVFEQTAVFLVQLPQLNIIDEGKLRKFGRYIHEGYKDNPYHNSLHAIDVMQTVHFLLNLPCFLGYFTVLEQFSISIAAAIHDYRHPGRNTDFLRNSMDALYVSFNGISPLESMHSANSLSAALGLACERTENKTGNDKDDVAWLVETPMDFKQQVHRCISQLVLATDMSKHVEIFSSFKDLVSTKKSEATSMFSTEQDRLLVLKMILKLADLSNTFRPWTACHEWAQRLQQEFMEQAAQERSLGLPVFKLGDGTMPLEKLQTSFYPMFVLPMLSTLSGAFEEVSAIRDVALSNYQRWASSCVPRSEEQP
ncbi:3'5'-cyclic nucleotide phosphodiesterase [Pelomyxa schiedti]|nr:3'5'-cyclic nucleotide phosphodiesterase [Pelomyxa schiedti]